MGNLCSSEDDKGRKGVVEAVCLDTEDIEKLEKEGMDCLACFNDSDHGRYVHRTLISSHLTPTNSISAGIATCKPKRQGLPSSAGGHQGVHRHPYAEIYFFLGGEGIVNVDMVEHKVKTGSVVFVPADAERSVRNESFCDELRWYYAVPVGSVSEVHCRFSNDIGRAVNL